MSETDRHAPPEMAPSQYIEKVSLLTGEVLEHEIQPRQLLVRYHRDYHVVDVQARRVMSRLVHATGDEELAREKVREARRFGKKAAGVLAKATKQDPERVAKTLFGLKEKEYYFRFRSHPWNHDEIASKVETLRSAAREKFEAARVGDQPRLRVLLTGGTGFVGKEVLWQAASDPAVAEVVVVIRPKKIRDRKTKKVARTLSPAERGEILLRQLWLDGPEHASKFRFVAGDVEEPHLGISEEDRAELSRTITHVIHSAASVAFDDPYEDSYRANVVGTLNALAFSRTLQETEGSPFVCHIGIETSYIHGRQTHGLASEDEIVFPRNFYNNYYELTKAMASIETERFMLEKDLRVIQLCPAIVIGESRAGNNRGDTKVVNAPVNVFGRAHQALAHPTGNLVDRSKGAMLARMACVFPGDPSAEINLVPVDRVAEGILAALVSPDAVGERVHLATDNRITSRKIQEIVEEEVGVKVKLAEPTFHRNVTLPMLSKTLKGLKQERLAHALQKLGTIFGGYSEWGQPVHEVGKDVDVLGLSDDRPNTEHCFRMLCRHNRWVQDFGKVRDDDEISRREKLWWEFIQELEDETGGPVGAMPAKDFDTAVHEAFDLESFERRS